jgi:hypothetical protein
MASINCGTLLNTPRRLLVDETQKLEPFLMAVPWHAGADEFAFRHVQRCEKRGRAVPLVIVRHGSTSAFLERKPGLCAIQGLNLTLFITAQHDGVLRRVEVQAHHVGHLGNEIRVVTQFESPAQVGLELVGLPDPADHRGAHAQFPGQGSRAPVGADGRFRANAY